MSGWRCECGNFYPDDVGDCPACLREDEWCEDCFYRHPAPAWNDLHHLKVDYVPQLWVRKIDPDKAAFERAKASALRRATA